MPTASPVSATEARADAVEVCISGAASITPLRELLGELNRLDRRQVGIVVHRVQ